jgi:subtilisin family serine protease
MARFSRIGFIGWLFCFLIAGSAYASSVDLIVRFKHPQKIPLQKFGHRLKSDIVNAEEGVVRLSFPTLNFARIVRDRLQRAGDILNVSGNHFYRPAINYRIRSTRRDSFFALPFAMNIEQTVLPEVQMPVAGTTGADPLVKHDWALDSINLHQIRPDVSANIVTAVIDTGVDYNHEDLINGMWRKTGAPLEVGYDFVHDVPKPYDQVHFDMEGCMKDFGCRLGIDASKFLVNPGHGTHCAGHVGAVYNNGVGMRGVGAGASIMGLKFFYDVGESHAGSGDDVAAIKSIDYAVQNGAKVINASWGSRINRAEAEKSELKQALLRAQKAGVIVVVAAGNDGVDLDSDDDPNYPAAYALDNMIVVAASGRDDTLADFSCYGKKTVHLAAPGVRILSTVPGSRYSDFVAKFRDNSGVEHQMDWDGTSMAAPMVAGAVALVWSQYPNADYHEIKDRVLRSVRKVSALDGKVATSGILDVAAALR